HQHRACDEDDLIEQDFSMSFFIEANDEAEIGELVESAQVASHYVRRVKEKVYTREVGLGELLAGDKFNQQAPNKLLDKMYCCGQVVPVIMSCGEVLAGRLIVHGSKALAEARVDEARLEGREPAPAA